MTLAHVVFDASRLERLRRGAVAVRSDPAVFSVTGMGALQCLQGMLTNDLAKPGDQSLIYGAMLTAKGMIVVDLWIVRRPQEFLLITDPAAREVALEQFRKQLPPRLARVGDRTGSLGWLRLYGEQALGALRFAGLGLVPEHEGGVTDGGTPDQPLFIARPNALAPFKACLFGSETALERASAALSRASVSRGGVEDAEAARILSGWPALGTEIQEKTLPQEVRYDAIDGVSYTKGCYTGQETVARLHFRGHTNRELRGLHWSSPTLATIADPTVSDTDGKEIGTVRSVLSLPDQQFGLALLRREVEPGRTVMAAGRPAMVIALPFAEALPDI
jgi:folate-binding protein YgfZ